MKIKQDPESLAALQKFSEEVPAIQAEIARVMKESQILHFARIVVIPVDGVPRYLQVLTTYDGEPRAYTEFFREKLSHVFKKIFSLAEGVDPSEAEKLVDDPEAFFAFSRQFDIRPLGESLSDDPRDGFVFSAYGQLTVKQILARLGDAAL